MTEKTYTFGNAKVIVFSPLAHMTKAEQKQFFKKEWEKGNIILKDIARAAHDCIMDAQIQEKQA